MGLTIDTVVSIPVILSVGLAVDYSVHICHAFMVLSGSRDGKKYLKSVNHKSKDIIYSVNHKPTDIKRSVNHKEYQMLRQPQTKGYQNAR